MMTALGLQLLWLAVRVSVVALLAAPLAIWSGRRAPRSAVIVLAAAVMICVALCVAAFVPMPDVNTWPIFVSAPSQDDAIADANHPMDDVADEGAPAAGVSLANAWRLFKTVSTQTPEEPAWEYGGIIVVAVYCIGVAIAGVRLFSGWLAIRRLHHNSRPIDDAGLLQLAESLRVALGCSASFELRECLETGLAATVGWWRRVIFLPPEWPEWTEAERKAVLAHELAHIHYSDYLIGFITRFCRVLYFYHPLIRWMTSHLRWQQELAADDLAATAVADRTQYLKALASLALRASPPFAGAAPWSAMTGAALLQRIHVLRGTAKSRPLGWTMRALILGLLTVTGLLVTTLGVPATSISAIEGTTPEANQAFEIGYLPPDSRGYFAIRPSVVFQQPGMDGMKKNVADTFDELKKIGLTLPDGLKPENIDEIVGNVDCHSKGTGKPGSRSFVAGSSSLFIRLNHEFDWLAFFKSLSVQVKALTSEELELTELREGGVSIHRLRLPAMLGSGPIFFSMPDRKSVVFSGFALNREKTDKTPDAFRRLLSNVAAARQRDWGAGHAKVKHAPIALVVDNRDQHFTKVFDKDFNAGQQLIFQNIRYAAVGIELGDGRPVRLVLDAKSADAAQELQNVVDGELKSMADEIKQSKETDRAALKLVSELWESHKVSRAGARLEWLGYSSVRLQHLYAPAKEK